MNISSANINGTYAKSPAFGHSNPWADSPYNKHDRLVIAGTTAIGVAASMAALAKYHKYSINPLNTFKGLKSDQYPLFSKKQFKHICSKLSEKYKKSY